MGIRGRDRRVFDGSTRGFVPVRTGALGISSSVFSLKSVVAIRSGFVLGVVVAQKG